MKIFCVDGQDLMGTGGALRGHEMGFALHNLGHDVRQFGPSPEVFQHILNERPDAVILAGTWHQLPGMYPTRLEEACRKVGAACIWWYGSNGSVFGAADSDPAVRREAEAKIIATINERKFITVICPYSMDIYERHGVERSKMRLVRSVFDEQLFRYALTREEYRAAERMRYRLDIAPDAFVLGTVGHCPNSKGADEIIRALPLLVDERPDLVYLMMHTPECWLSKVKAKNPQGEPVGLSELDVLNRTKQLARDLGVEKHVRFAGMRLPREAMPAFYNAVNVYCSPSKAENLGQPLVESQLCGVPLVTFKGFSFDFVACPHSAVQIEPSGTVTDDYGLVIPETTPEAVAEALRHAIEFEEELSEPRVTREWAAKEFGHHNAQAMVDAINEYRA